MTVHMPPTYTAAIFLLAAMRELLATDLANEIPVLVEAQPTSDATTAQGANRRIAVSEAASLPVHWAGLAPTPQQNACTGALTWKLALLEWRHLVNDQLGSCNLARLQKHRS